MLKADNCSNTTQSSTSALSNTFSILGSGWLGLPLALSLQEEHQRVNVSTTHHSRLSELQAKGLIPFIINIDSSLNLNLNNNLNSNLENGTRNDAVINSFLEAHTLIINITSKSIEGFSNLIPKIESSPVKHVLFVSSTSVYPFTNSTVSEKDSNPEHPLAQIEQLFFESQSFTTSVLRLAGTFGYSRHPGRFFKQGKVVRNPDSPVNLIHQDDCLGIIHRIIKKAAWGEIFNGVCDEHPSKRAFYAHAATHAKMPTPNFSSEESEQCFKIVSNEYLKERLNYQFIHPQLMSLDFKSP